MKTTISILKFLILFPIAYVFLFIAGCLQILWGAFPAAWNWVFAAEQRRRRLRKMKSKLQNQNS